VETQRWKICDADPDHHKIKSPKGGDHHGKHQMNWAHWKSFNLNGSTSINPATLENQSILVKLRISILEGVL